MTQNLGQSYKRDTPTPMSKKIKLLLIAGARPNFMKIAPLIKAVRVHNSSIQYFPEGNQTEIDLKLVHTGQHYDFRMSDVFFKELEIPEPDYNLEVGSGSHASQTAKLMLAFEPVCLKENPDWVVVVGDVNSTMACTLVASKLGIKVAHVEAGLRSFDRGMPEEINRLVTDALADLLLTPSEDADENLRREGIPKTKIEFVGNIMIDSLVANLPKARRSTILQDCNVTPGSYIYVTLHRPSNVDDRSNLTALLLELSQIAKTIPIVFPMHPRTCKMLSEFGIQLAGEKQFRILDPVGYHDSLCLTENARLVLTDSGGLQEESTYFSVPCLTLRANTERPVTITVGSNKLTKLATLQEDVAEVLGGPVKRGNMPRFWDGSTTRRVVNLFLRP